LGAKPPKAEHFLLKGRQFSNHFCMEMFRKSTKVELEIQVQIHVKHTYTRTGYTEMNAFGYYLNALNSGAISNFKLGDEK